MKFLIMNERKKSNIKKLREIRDQVSDDINGMTLEQEKHFIKKELNNLKSKRCLK